MRYVIYFLLFVSSNIYAQTYQVEKKKLDILLDVYFFDYPACSTALSKSHLAIDSLKVALTAGQKLIELRTEQRDLKVKESQLWESRFSNKEALQKVEIKKALKKGNKKMVSGFIVGALLALLIL